MIKISKDIEKTLLIQLQEISEEISNLIYKGDYETIPALEKRRLGVIKCFKEKPSKSGLEKITQIIDQNKVFIKDIEDKKYQLKKKHKVIEEIFLAYGKW